MMSAVEQLPIKEENRLWAIVRQLSMEVAYLRQQLEIHQRIEQSQWREILGDKEDFEHKPGLRLALRKDLLSVFRGAVWALKKDREAVNKAVYLWRDAMRRGQITDEDMQEIEKILETAAKIPDTPEIQRFIEHETQSIWEFLAGKPVEGFTDQ
jgi:hypothetical protein